MTNSRTSGIVFRILAVRIGRIGLPFIHQSTNLSSLRAPGPRGGIYLSFSVVSANNANISDAIQKRTMIFDSDQPSNSK